jgi:hypothetical protein
MIGFGLAEEQKMLSETARDITNGEIKRWRAASIKMSEYHKNSCERSKA